MSSRFFATTIRRTIPQFRQQQPIQPPKQTKQPLPKQPLPNPTASTGPIDYAAAAKSGTPIAIDSRALAWTTEAGAVSPLGEKALVILFATLGAVVIGSTFAQKRPEKGKKFQVDPEFVKQQSDADQISYESIRQTQIDHDNYLSAQLAEKLPIVQAKQAQKQLEAQQNGV